MQNEQKMKNIVTIPIAIFMIACGLNLKAQNCTDIVLAKFNYDTALMSDYPDVKLDYFCRYAKNAFYESDIIPDGADVVAITEVRNNTTGLQLQLNYEVNIESLNYYEYNFSKLQMRYYRTDHTICFPTPNSRHKYLVLRSLDEIYDRTENPQNYVE